MTGGQETQAVGTGAPPPYPVRVDAVLEPRLSRGLWLVKWLLLFPHYVVLTFLWAAFVVLSVVAFFAILITGRYPRAVFDFNVGVLRWTWRVHYYGYGALGTDRYPPFTLAEVPDYPARIAIDYPERLSRGLVLVKWWLLAIPHYIVLGVFVGGGVWFSTRSHAGDWNDGWAAGGLVGLLVLISAVVLLFTGRYPAPLYDFVMGMDRWALRVAAYVGLMTDRYPPFRLDNGGADPGTFPVEPPTPPPTPPAGGAPIGRPGGWTAGRVVAVVVGAVLLFLSTGLLAGGGGLLWADRTQRDGGYLWSPASSVSTSSYALATDRLRIEGSAADWAMNRVVGTAELKVASTDPATELFVGIAPTTDANSYLGGVRYTRMGMLGGSRMGSGMMTGTVGGAPRTPPADSGIWVSQASGSGTQTLRWQPSRGDWTVVVMRADGGPGVSARLQAGATVPGAAWIATGLLVVGAVLLAGGGLLVGLAVRGAGRRPPATPLPPAYFTGPPGPQQPTPDQPTPDLPAGTAVGPPA